MSSCFRLGKSQLENRFWNALLMALEAGNCFLIAPFIFLVFLFISLDVAIGNYFKESLNSRGFLEYFFPVIPIHQVLLGDILVI